MYSYKKFGYIAKEIKDIYCRNFTELDPNIVYPLY
jgi:hypothetical protein